MQAYIKNINERNSDDETLDSNGNPFTLRNSVSYAMVYAYNGDDEQYRNARIVRIHRPRRPHLHYTMQTDEVKVTFFRGKTQFTGLLRADFLHLNVYDELDHERQRPMLEIEWCRVKKLTLDRQESRVITIQLIDREQGILFHRLPDMHQFVDQCIGAQFLYRTKIKSRHSVNRTRTRNRFLLAIGNAFARAFNRKECYKSNLLLYVPGRSRALNSR